MYLSGLILAIYGISTLAYPNGKTIDEIIRQSLAEGQTGGDGAWRVGKMQDSQGFVRVDMDMLFTRDQWEQIQKARESSRPKRKAIRNEYFRWSNNKIPYKFAQGHFDRNERYVIMKAMSEWEKHTCLEFHPTRTLSGSMIVFRNGGECSSFIGQLDWAQPILLGRGCRIHGIIVHEVGHALGLKHEQTRPDRDRYVTIHQENIMDGAEINFLKFPESSVNTYDVPYDYLSIMHYGDRTFSKNNKPTITTVDPKFQSKIGNRERLSFSDIKLMNLMYECAEVNFCPEKLCPDNGFLDKNCVCQCPGDPTRPCFHNKTLSTRSPKATTVVTARRCVDRHLFCVVWARGNGCRSLFFLMSVYCKHSCGFCKLVAKKTTVSVRPPSTTRFNATTFRTNATTIGKVATSTPLPTVVQRTSDYTSTVAKTRVTKGSRCVDKNSNCLYWFKKGYCNSRKYQPYMTKDCAKSCGMCHISSTTFTPSVKRQKTTVRQKSTKQTSTTFAPSVKRRKTTVTQKSTKQKMICRDNSLKCRRWRIYCNHPRHLKFMQNNCARTCGRCNSGPCRDLHRHCQTWANKGYCFSFAYKVYMSQKCRRSCKLCANKTTRTTRRCFDRNYLCGIWTMRRQCVLNPNYMRVNCRKSCNFC